MATKRKPGRPKTRKVAGANPTKIGITGTNGKKKWYTRTLCGSKSEMAKKAEGIRAAGGTARVIANETGSGACLYKGPRKAKPVKPRSKKAA